MKINLALKRIIDVVSSFLGLIILSPIFLITAAAIKHDSEGPVIFSQNRRTKDGRVFRMYKFRSMYVDSEKRGSGLFNYENDPRVTKVGRFLRDTSIDELPQIVNVLRGDLSLVGPRPCVEYELGDFDTLNSRYKKRFEMKAGITGLAQVMGRNENSWEEKVSYDNEYIDAFKRRGVLLDIKILFLTFIKAFRGSDIYETKPDETMDDAEAAMAAEREIIRLAHIPDGEKEESVV